MKAELTIDVYVGSTPAGDVIVSCKKGEPIDPALLRAHKEKLIAIGAVSDQSHTREKGHGKSKRG